LWVIAIPAGLVGLFIIVLCLPVDTSLSVNTSERPMFRLRLRWLFGLISKDLSREKKKPKAKKKPPERKPKEKPKRKKGRIRFSTVLKILRTKGLLKQIKYLVKGILSQLKIRELVVNLRLGLDDPADTGLAFAFIGATTHFLTLPPKYQIKVQPYFAEKVEFEGYLRGVLRIYPILLVGPVLRFTFSPAVFKVVKTLVLSKWKRKK